MSEYVEQVFWALRRIADLTDDLATKDAEIARLREALEWARETLQEINPSNYDHDDVCSLNNASVEVILGIDAALSPIPDPAGGMPVEVECARCHGQTVEPDFNGYCPVCHDDMGGSA